MTTAGFDIADREDGGAELRLTGDWTTAGIDRGAQRLNQVLGGRRIAALDLSDMGRFDTSGALAVFLAGGPSGLPDDAWAARPEADVAIWVVELEAGARFELPAATGPDTIRTLYVYEGTGIEAGGHHLGTDTGAVVRCDRALELVAGDAPAEVLVLQGRPIGEPVARYGPFVMNTEAEIHQAFQDYQRTGFGGWPWDDDAPQHGATKGRFAQHADGRVEHR